MFLPCPHCQFLVAHHPQLRPLPVACPNCGKPLQEDEPGHGADIPPAAPAPVPRPAADAAMPAAPEAAATVAACAPALDASAGDDTGSEAGSDAGGDTGNAIGNDTGPDSGTSTDTDIGPDTGISAETEAGSDSGAAVEAEAGPAAGSDHHGSIDADADADAADATIAPDPAIGADERASPTAAATAAAPFSVTSHTLARWRWPLVAMLALLLVVQSLLADRVRLAADPQWRPLLTAVCTVLRCELPPWREPGALRMLDRKVRAVPEPSGALRVDATFRNDARWAQAWPALQLTLTDAHGRTLGSGVFAPEDYLGVVPDTLLAPGQSAQVTFLVQEPAPGTVAFAFRFR